MPILSRRLLATALVLVNSVAAPGQEVPQGAGFGRVRKLVQDHVDRREIAGAVVLVVHRGRPVCFEAFGRADAEAGRPMRPDTIFRIASMTKPITTVAALMLTDEGRLKLTDPVSKYLPEFAAPAVLATRAVGAPATVAARGAITIHHLLTHTSGLTYGLMGKEPLSRLYRETGVSDGLVQTDGPLADNVKRLARLPLLHEPGTAWEYGLSTDVLGRVIEVVAGQSLEAFLTARIFRPLGMADTHFFLPADKRPRLAALYRPGRDHTVERVGEDPVQAGAVTYSAGVPYRGPRTYYSGGAGLVSTAADYARFLRMLTNGGELDGTRVLKRETVALMTSNQVGDLTVGLGGHGDKFGYGFGVVTPAKPAGEVASVGSYSWGGIYNTYFWVDPPEELVGILLTQLFPFDHLKLRSEFQRLVYEAVRAGPRPAKAAATDGRFVRLHWFEHGAEHGNPSSAHNGRFRVNAPEVVTHPTYAVRREVRGSGMMQILMEEDLRRLAGAELYLELWGGHPGTANRRVTVNGRTTYPIAAAGGDRHCTHLYPALPLKVTDLVNGYNALQFACDQGSTFWGHFIVDNACLRAELPPDHSDLRTAGLANFRAAVRATPSADGEAIDLAVDAPAEALAAIARVDYQGYYRGYDENGTGRMDGWHGFTKRRQPVAFAGHAAAAPFAATWDVSMLPAQEDAAVRAIIHFKGRSNLIYVAPAVRGLRVPVRADAEVRMSLPTDMPEPFWSRAGRKKACTIDWDVDPDRVERAELHVVVWDGGAGTVKDAFTLNGHALPVAGDGKHDVLYSRVRLDPKTLRRGANRVELLSDTEHHGIEVLLPGPALVARVRR